MKVSDIKIIPVYRGDEARVSMTIGPNVDMDFEPVIASYIAFQLLKAANYFDDRLPILPETVTFYLVEEDHDWRICQCENCATIRVGIELDGGKIHDY